MTANKWYLKLLNLTTDSSFIPKNFNEDAYKKRYELFEEQFYCYRLPIRNHWQLPALLGDTSAYSHFEHEAPDAYGNTILHYAGFSGKVETLAFALESPLGREHLGTQNFSGSTFLHCAAHSGNKETLGLALKKYPRSIYWM